MDIMCDSADLLADIHDAFRKKTDPRLGVLELLKKRAIEVLRELDACWLEGRRRCSGNCKEVFPDPENTITVDDDGLLFPSILVFENFWSGYTISMHNSIRILLLQALKLMSVDDSEVPEPLVKTDSAPLLGITSDVRGLACEIIRSIEYCYIQSEHYLGTSCFVLPLDVAYGCLEKDSREAKWLQETKKIKLPKINGFAVGEPDIKALQPLFDDPFES